MSSRRAHLRARKRLSNTARALIVVSVLLGVILGGGAGVALWFQHQLDGNIERIDDPFAQIANRPTPAPTPDGAAAADVNFLVLGSDSRISAGDPSQWQQGAQRTDTIMLVHLPADRSSAQVISIPRDTWVPIPGRGNAKINAAFAFGGPALMIETVEQLTGVHIDHFLLTDFTSFTRMTDALGGVQIRIPQDIGDGNRVFFEAGVHQMTGEQALDYVRQRHGLVNGDFGRVQRQQNWIRAILAKVNNNRNDVGRMTSFLTTVSQSIAADEGFTMNRMRDLFMSARSISTNDVTFMTAPHSGTGRSPDGQSIVVLDRERFDPLMAAIAGGTASQFIAEHSDYLDKLPATVR